MKTSYRTVCFAILWLASHSLGICQEPNAGSVRTLDDLRNEWKKKNADSSKESSTPGYGSGGMPGGGPGMDGGTMGMPGMDSAMGMPGMPGMGASGYLGSEGPPPTEKQLYLQLIQQLRGRLVSKKFKRENVEKQLRSALQQYFLADMEERVLEFDKVQARVNEMEMKLQRRLANENDIIELQLKQMIHRADGLDLSVPGEPMGMGMGMDGGMGMGSMDMGGMAGGMGMAGSAMGGSTGSSEPIGYDFSFRLTRLNRLTSDELEEGDPLKSYAETQETALPDKTGTQPPFGARRNDSEKMKTLLAAFHLFHTRFQHFPGSANRHLKEQPPHSWRVAILPFIGHGELFKEYRFDQPWDSETNLKVAKKMPEIYRRSGGNEKEKTPFVMLVDGGAFGSSNRTVSLADITDGSSNTIALIESVGEFPWTKPEDILYDPKSQDVPMIGPTGVVGMADGTTRSLHLSLKNIAYYRAMITRAGGEIVGNEP